MNISQKYLYKYAFLAYGLALIAELVSRNLSLSLRHVDSAYRVIKSYHLHRHSRTYSHGRLDNALALTYHLDYISWYDVNGSLINKLESPCRYDTYRLIYSLALTSVQYYWKG